MGCLQMGNGIRSGPSHGHQIGKHIQRTTNDVLQMQHGSLYPALHRLEKRGWVVSKWEMASDLGLLMATRSASTFSGLRMTFCRCSTGHSIPPCIVWKSGDGLSPNGKWLRIAIENSGITGLRIRAENNLWSKNRNGGRWRKLSRA